MGSLSNSFGMFFFKDSNGNWVPFSNIVGANIQKTDIPNPPPAEVTTTGEVAVTGEITLSDESAAQWWAISQGGIEIVER